MKRNGTKVQKRHTRDFWRRYTERRANWWRYQKTGVRPKHRGCSKGEKAIETCFSTMQCLQTYKEMPGSHPELSRWQKLFSIRILRCGKSRRCDNQQTGRYIPTLVLSSSRRIVSFASLCILNSQFSHQSLGHNWEMEAQLHPCCWWLGNFIRWTIAKILTTILLGPSIYITQNHPISKF